MNILLYIVRQVDERFEVNAKSKLTDDMRIDRYRKREVRY